MNKRTIKMLSVIATAALISGSLLPVSPAFAAETQKKGFENGAADINISQLARYASGMSDPDGGVMEIIDYNSKTGFAYAVNGKSGLLTAISLDDIKNTGTVNSLNGKDIDVKSLIQVDGFVYGDMTSVAVSPDGNILAAAIQAEGCTDNGRAAIFKCNSDGTLTFIRAIETGVQPDMITFTQDGKNILTANEGEPRDGYTEPAVDPEGTVTVINTDTWEAVNADFNSFTHDKLVTKGVVLKKNTSPSADLEPEYIAADNNKAYVSLQEANAIAVLDIASKSFTDIYPLVTVDYGTVKIDLNKGDGKYEPDNYTGVYGLRMPDGISLYNSGDKSYIITANEGDSREWGTEPNVYSNEDSNKLTSDSGVQTGKKVTMLNTSDYDGVDPDKTYLYGSRSFTVFEVTETGLNVVFDSGSDFEAKTAQYLPDFFNCSNDSLDVDDRSNKKGPEPETVVTGEVNGKIYAFVTLERIGGVMIYDITTPSEASFVNYINSRDFSSETGSDDSPEGLKFIPSEKSTTGNAMLAAACEVGGTVAVYEITPKKSVNASNIGTFAGEDGSKATAFTASLADVTGTLSFSVTSGKITKKLGSTNVENANIILGIIVNGLDDATATGVLTVE